MKTYDTFKNKNKKALKSKLELVVEGQCFRQMYVKFIGM